MAKIVKFPSKERNVVEQLEFLLEKAKEGDIKRFVFAAELNRKEQEEDSQNLIATTWVNADVGDRQYLLSHLQLDIVHAVVEVNFFEE
jgi:hypothetical protein